MNFPEPIDGDASSRKPGRPAQEKLDSLQKEIADKVAALLGQGVPVTHACALVDLPTSTYYTWLDRFPDFKKQVDRARAYAVASKLEIINKAIRAGSVEDAWKFLLHCFPQDFAKTRVEISGPNGAPLSGGVVILPQKDPDPISVNPVPKALTDADRPAAENEATDTSDEHES